MKMAHAPRPLRPWRQDVLVRRGRFEVLGTRRENSLGMVRLWLDAWLILLADTAILEKEVSLPLEI